MYKRVNSTTHYHLILSRCTNQFQPKPYNTVHRAEYHIILSFYTIYYIYKYMPMHLFCKCIALSTISTILATICIVPSTISIIPSTIWNYSKCNTVANLKVTHYLFIYSFRGFKIEIQRIKDLKDNIFYVPPARKLVFSLQLTVAQCSIFRQKGMKCKIWTAHAPIAMKRSSILLILLLFRTALASYWQSLVHLNCACVY